MPTRYLTKQEKEKTLGYLREAYKKASLAPDGYLDLEMIPYLERINACDGMVTLQSCTGHKKSKKRNWTAGGHLHLKLSEETMEIFDEKTGVLVKSKLINQVTILYSYYKKTAIEKIVNIHYQGHEDDFFYQAMEFITKFFEGLKRRKK